MTCPHTDVFWVVYHGRTTGGRCYDCGAWLAAEMIDAAHDEALIEDWLLDRSKARKLTREIDAAHDFALNEEAFRKYLADNPPSPLKFQAAGCRVCWRPLTSLELVHLTHPIVLCFDCRGVE
jgi:hypothetical protein